MNSGHPFQHRWMVTRVVSSFVVKKLATLVVGKRRERVAG